MLSQEQEALVRQFRAYLEERREEGEEGGSVDLYTLFGEMAALKNEVRIESRQVKGALDHFRSLVEPLQQGNTALQGEIERLREERRQAAREALRPLLLELLELRDRMAAGLEMASGKRTIKRLFKRLFRKEQEILDLWREGQEMTLHRLEQILAARGVHPLEMVGRPLDPRLARAVRVEQHKGVVEGVVLQELRQGFLWGEELLRPAEVVVNRGEER